MSAKKLLQAYFDRWQIEINHRDEKSILGVGQAQVWADLSVPRVPALMVATYSLMLLSVLETYGPKRTNDYELLPKWRNAARRPSCQDAVTLLRKQIEARQEHANKRRWLPHHGSNRRGLNAISADQTLSGSVADVQTAGGRVYTKLSQHDLRDNLYGPSQLVYGWGTRLVHQDIP